MVASADILSAIRELTNSKQLDRGELHELLQDGIYAALAKKHGPTVQAEVDIDEDRGQIRIVLLKTVVEEVADQAREIAVEEARFEDPEFQIGDVMEIPVQFEEFGRAAVQAAKQRIIQRVREGERTRIKDEFSSKVGELLSGEVQQIERGKLVIMLNRFREAEAIIPYREQNHREHFHQGETIRAVLKRVEDTPKGPRLILSRSDALFVQALFKLEVPEIPQGLVEIRAAAREVGSRTKIAVFSRDDAVDPVGACVGLKGARVQAVVNELGGERIDIVPWSADPERFAKLALAPAKVARVFSDPASRTIQAIVDEDSSRWRSAATGRTCGSRRAHGVEDRSLLEPRVDGARRRRAGAGRGRRRGDERTARGDCRHRPGGGGDPRERRLPHAERRPGPRARGLPAAARYDASDADRLIALLDELTMEDEEEDDAAAADGGAGASA
jgi:N utilization substance protein A